MKPSLSEDITSMVAIAVGASITIGLTAAPLLRESVVPTDRAVAAPVIRIPDGYRAVTVPVSDAGEWAESGTRVYVMVTLDDDVRGERQFITQVVLQNVPVLRNDRSITRDENGQAAEINFVTLLVTPAEAEMLAMAETIGSLHFAVRAALPTISMPEGKRESGVLRRMPR